MKIREKLFFLLTGTVIVFMIIFNSIVLSIFSREYQTDALETDYHVIKQILYSYSYNSKDISRFLFDSCKSENASDYLSGLNHNAQISLNMILKSITTNNKAVKSGIFVADNGVVFPMSQSKEADVIEQLWNNGYFDSDDDVKWFCESDGKMFLKRNIYRIFPHEVVGCGVFEIDAEYLRAVTGVDNLKAGSICIIDRFGDYRLTSAEADIDFFDSLISTLRTGEQLEQTIEYQGQKFFILTVNGAQGTENAIFTVPETELMGPYYRVKQITLRITLLIVLVSGVVSFVLSHLFTKSLRTFKQRINDIPITNDQLAKIEEINNRDEIGELAKDFNGLLERINTLNQETRAQQNAKYEMLEWQYRALQSQVSPHFLCNILSSISMLAAVGNNQVVQSLSVNASKYLRRNLNCSSSKYSTIEEEIQIAQEYIDLASAMSAVQISLITECTRDLKKIKVPCYLLQPLVENSIKHGMPPQNADVFNITIRVDKGEDDKVIIQVSDNGRGFDDVLLSKLHKAENANDSFSENLNFGLEGIIERLRLQYANQFAFQLFNLPEGGAAVEMVLPTDYDSRSLLKR